MNFDAVTAYLDAMPARGIPGCHMTILVDHKPVYSHLVGEARPGKLMRGDETYWLYSASKLITMTAMAQLIERGLVKLDDPVSKYLPVFANLTVRDGDAVRPARTVMTIEHLITMQSGMNYDLQSPSILKARREGRTSTVELAEAFAGEPLSFEPGEHFLYSLGHDVAGAIIETVTGKSFGEYLEENIFAPLGMNDLTFHPSEDQRARRAARYVWDSNEKPVLHDNSDNPYVLSCEYESGGAGLTGSVDCYVLIADALANGGVGRTGARILTPESIDMMRTDHLRPQSRIDYDKLGRIGYGYGLGVRVMVDNTHSRSPIGEFGWDGAAGAWVLIDPEHHVAAFYAQHVLGCSRAFHEFHPAMRDLIYEALDL